MLRRLPVMVDGWIFFEIFLSVEYRFQNMLSIILKAN
jgi:hypothetical protein